ncbi:GNAT family N-acetyltransferase [Pseudomonas solani]|uniref:GNAT family N-acetyltransferase n=1 Tax=Pseudomonas solani TaxID=2731552 RepID=UPI0035BE2829
MSDRVSIHLAGAPGIQAAEKLLELDGYSSFRQVMSGELSAALDEECYLLALGGDYVGFAVIRGASAGNSGFFEIFRLFVAASARGKGVGRRAVAQIIDLLKKRGKDELVLEIESDIAASFWESVLQGYKIHDLHNGKRIVHLYPA